MSPKLTINVLIVPFLLAVLVLDDSESYVDMVTDPTTHGGPAVVRATIAKMDHAFESIDEPTKFWSIEHSHIHEDISICGVK